MWQRMVSFLAGTNSEKIKVQVLDNFIISFAMGL